VSSHAASNKLIHLASLSMTKIGDGLVDPKLVLSWALNAAGAPQAAIGLLVPLRESLAMLPQILEAAWLQGINRRKLVWAAGSAVQGMSVAAMALVLSLLEGAVAGWSVVGLVVVFALGRSLASVSYKDVLGRTVDKGSRGSVTGYAGSVASVVVLLFGAGLSFGVIPLTLTSVIIAICMAAGAWCVASGVFMLLREGAGDEEEAGQAPAGVRDVVTLLIEDRQLQRFTLARFLMSATALAPPFILSAAHGDGSAPGSQLGSLGPFVLASSIASILGSSAWGVASDRSSRRVMICAALLAAVVLGVMAAVLLSAGQQIELPVLETSVALFVLMMAYQGVRRGRSTHIVDMAPQDQKSSYAAVSNTVVGLLLLGGGVLGVIADVFGLAVVFVLLAVMCVAGAMVAFGLQDVQST
jgi:hypothetical protein